MELTKEQHEEVNLRVEDTFCNEHDSKEFIIACVREHYEKEVLEE